jgi:amino acid adenylation domain-containing protein
MQKDKSHAASAWEGMESLGGEERSNYPVDMSVDDMGQGFELVGQVSPAIGAQRLCEYMRAAVASIADALAEHPEQAIGEVELLTATERRQLRAWSENTTRYPSAEPVHRLIERQARRRPQATALIFGDEQLSYAELNTQANRLAHHLTKLGVKSEGKVGIALERSIEMVVGLLAIFKAGAAYVPLDPEYPAERLAYMVEDSGIELLLTQNHVRERKGLRVLELDVLDLSGEPEHDPRVAVHGESLAYVIYTSGSTGRPKGVGIPHRSLVEHVQVSVDFFGLTSTDRMLQFATLNFDGCIEQLFPPLLAGAAIVLRGPALWDSATFHRELLDKQISVVDITTAYWLLLVQDFARQGIRNYGVLRQLHAGGEAMPPEGLKAWRDAGLAHVKLLNTYGPTEATVTASILDCQPYVSGQQPLPPQIPIGTPLAGRALQVVDANLNHLPQGVAGELCIGGELLARGYLNRASLSAERFVADPFDKQGGRLYRTGDLVRWNTEGQLEYLGRIDHQVKVRGFRIELGEVEAQLLAQPEVREAVVIAQLSPGGARLVGYVSVQTGQVIEVGELRERLGEILPDYMVPSAIAVLENLPLNANGKVDRKALPALEFGSTRAYESPQGEVEEALAQIWAEVLGVERVGRYDNFFELGGDSLLAIRLVGSVRTNMDIAISLRDLYAFPTLRELSTHNHRDTKIVRLNTVNSNVFPLIVIHDGYGSILDYAELAKAMKDHCAVAALPYSHQAGRRYESLCDLATEYAQTIVATGYREPYRLCGWCLGGAIAPLVAGILESEGKQVEFVGAIDPYVLDSIKTQNEDIGQALLNFIVSLWRQPPQLAKYQEAEIRKQIKHAALAPDTIPNLLDDVLSMGDDDLLRAHGKLGGVELSELFMAGRVLGEVALSPINPVSLHAPVTVWWARQRSYMDRIQFAKWLNLNTVQHCEVQGDHYEAIRSPETLQSIVHKLSGM